MRLCTVSTSKVPPFFGVELGKKILRVRECAHSFEYSPADIAKISTTLDYLQNLPASEKLLRALLKRISESPKLLARPASDGHPFLVAAEEVTWHPPVQRPGKILCIGMNYRDHCEEKNQDIPKKPVVFNKFATSLLGAGAEIPLPLKSDKNVDYEAELCVVIGRKARRVSAKTAMKHVAGYTIMNDISLRSIQKSEPQWSRAKGFDGSGPCGPSIVTADEIPDPHALKIACRLNGRQVQASNTSNLIFKIPDLIAFITKLVTLEPGDMISTGTPGGVGAYSTPPRFLQPGDIVEVQIDRLGILKNSCGKA
ncbi:fumarylacetoacetate hydrolase family protein [Candidatus Sumerlaeota bacterium]|nr:fumarylacetoacetate hydrolase family protein [Candidatus Sumerlaeota bacterium]